MKVKLGEICWHEKQRVLSLDFDSTGRLATSGSDNNVNIWRLHIQEDGSFIADIQASLNRHQKSVNCVRFAPSGELLASGGDDGMIYIWRHDKEKDNPNAQSDPNNMLDDKIPDKECWVVQMSMRGQDDVYDLAWAPDATALLSASTDCSARVWDLLKNGRSVQELKDHRHYVQGVSWDPRGRYVLTQSSDRTCRLYELKKRGKAKQFLCTTTLRDREDNKEKLFLNESVLTFFRRPAFSPCGSLLFLPTGQHINNPSPAPPPVSAAAAPSTIEKSTAATPFAAAPSSVISIVEGATGNAITIPTSTADAKEKEKAEKEKADKELAEKVVPPVNGTYVYSVNNAYIRPVLFLPCGAKPSIAVRCHPTLFQLRSEGASAIFNLPYRVIFAVATLESIFIYDTQSLHPIALVSGYHLAGITDLAWTADGRCLAVSSSDGYVSLISFAQKELGVPLDAAEQAKYLPRDVSVAAQVQEVEVEVPAPTPTAPSPASASPALPPPPAAAAAPAPASTTTTAAPATASADAPPAEGEKKKRRIAPILVTPTVSVPKQ